ncbi:MAG TPA: D-tyrosyl-tRNA(Tyr) deacylase [Candidatus Anaerobutyricum stercoris]|uniref:D-aminoacyl-tRNA deacylase n=1 Tax=Candidatus Anaerobutyricum stercoris TaxID=2838457 RepID=A0A9D2EJY5_9FIRM|nr:D-aminoacyl-tRNA deacylase [Eubacterium sp. An3]OUO25507.1 D-tyrosyl-tRNA(Tyr) deacylase [Eubacterium sp. An3]CVI72742.1 D-tyrosyl-tRNA(Tyr) deacylase [Eubacteriaceae bacterium CHKCI004]HIZ39088.1 D-tyrosyl-tRNA(Tyr) deacylase [Candidatus Anaerobutyricum stercoris]
MKAVIQLVSKAAVTVEREEKREIGPGYVILLGVAEGDTEETMKKMVKKIIDLRLFQDENGKTNLSVEDVKGDFLVVSQFTLLADCRKGRRPSFVKAGNPAEAKKIYEAFIEECKKRIDTVKHGEFGAYMQVELVNDGPFTIVLDSDEL